MRGRSARPESAGPVQDGRPGSRGHVPRPPVALLRAESEDQPVDGGPFGLLQLFPSRLDSTKSPDFMSWPHSGRAGASLLVWRTLTERPFRPDTTGRPHLLRRSVDVLARPLPPIEAHGRQPPPKRDIRLMSERL